MQKRTYKTSVFIFRRDLRLHDNTGLIKAATNSDIVIPIFNIDPVQVGPSNKYRSIAAIQFMTESLHDLVAQHKAKNAKLFVLYGDVIQNVQIIIQKHHIDALFINHDYTPFSKKRDDKLQKLCTKYNVAFHAYHDELLIGNPDNIKNSAGKPFTRYTPFFKRTRTIAIATPQRLPKNANFYRAHLVGQKNLRILEKIVKANKSHHVHGGTRAARKILRTLKNFKHYDHDRNFPARGMTTHLSAAHKFGVISIRESYHAITQALGQNTQLIAELYWRDFFTYLAYHAPHIFGKPFYKKFGHLSWSPNKHHFRAWRMGTTGFPIVDAGMRQLNKTGWMHNRVRMIAASFLVKDLHIDWRWGERYFATQLIDYDPAVNNGNWQWIASTGADAQPYFRIFNPWLQQKKFDTDCHYIKKWLPELQEFPNKIIHTWYADQPTTKDYPKPIVHHEEEATKSINAFKKLRSKNF